MVYWLEENGYDVSYFTDVDSDRNGALIPSHQVFLSVGHDEYWSAAQRANVTAARDAGVNLAFFSGNESFWKTRWETSIDGTGTPYRTLVCYKETHANAVIDPMDPPIWTGTWRDPRFSPPADGGRPENALTGTIFMVNGNRSDAITVPAAYGDLRFWRDTSIASLAPGTTATLPTGTLGYEWDEDLDNGFRPAGLMDLSSTTLDVSGSFLEDYGSTYGPGTATHSLTLYRAPSGALVFGAGTVQWSWGLAVRSPDARMQQATVNLLADMHVQPATLQAGLVAATASTDTTPPTSTITAPAAGASVPYGSPTTITGTAIDGGGGGVVAGVEVSVDGGTTWHPAVGRESWSYTWTPSVSGPVTIMSRAVDDSGNLETPSPGISVTVVAPAVWSLWGSSATPLVAAAGDGNAVEVGVKFRSDSAGSITGLRFYKGGTNTGTHVGSLWTAGGTLLARATFTGESASGWQQVLFAAPVAIAANTLYVASYHTNVGHYSQNTSYFSAAGVDAGPLHAPSSGSVNGNGVYTYGASSAFPVSSYQASNYWVDVLFSNTQSPATSTALASSANPSAYGQSVTFTATVTAGAPGSGTPTGSVTFYDGATALGAATLVGGAASFSTAALAVGAHTITASYGGDAVFTASTSPALTQVVDQAATSTVLASSANPSAYGQSVTFTATVSVSSPGAGTPTGTVTFKDGAATLGTGALTGGVATFTTGALSVASHSITAVYGGDINSLSSTSVAIIQLVNKDDSTAALSSSANPSVFNQTVSFAITVTAAAPGSGTPTGIVQFQIDGTNFGTPVSLVNGVATSGSTSALTIGNHSVTASYSGDANFNAAAAPGLNQVVQKDNSTTSVASSVNPSSYGQSVTFTATVAAVALGSGTPTGSVTFMDGTTSVGTAPLSGGTASLATGAVEVGSHSISAVYGGDGNFTTSTSSALVQTVNQASTTTTITSSANPSVYSQAVTLTAEVVAAAPGSGTPGGTVTFYDGRTALGTGTLSGGVATFTTSTLTVGKHPITAVYGGSASFKTSTSAALSQTVNHASSSTSLASSANPSVFGQTVTFTVRVGAVAPAGGTPTGTVTFKDGPKKLGTATLSGGTTNFTTSALSIGTHSITAVYQGDSNFKTSTSAVLSQVVQRPAGAAMMATSPTAATMSSTAAAMGSAPSTGSTAAAMGSAQAGTARAVATADVVDLVIAPLGQDAASGTPVEDLVRERFAARRARLIPGDFRL